MKGTSYYISGRRMSVALGAEYAERLTALAVQSGQSTSGALAGILASACDCSVTDDIPVHLEELSESIGVAPYALIRLIVHDVFNGGRLASALALAKKGAGM